jgi:hypothetical protein
MSEAYVEFDPPNRVAGDITSPEEAAHVRVRLGMILLLGGIEFLGLRQLLREDLERLIAWEEERI